MSSWIINLLVLVGVLAIAAIALWFVMSQMTLPEPVQKIITILLVIVIAIVAIIMLVSLKDGKLGGIYGNEIKTASQQENAISAPKHSRLRGLPEERYDFGRG